VIHDLISSFNAGELSPYLSSRTNLDKYRSGCSTLENYLITPYGPANRRSGTEYLGSAKTSATRCRLIGLNLSDANRIVLELGVGYMRFWKDGALMTHPVAATWNGVAYTTSSLLEAVGITYASTATAPVYAATSGSVGTPHPYTESDLRSVAIVQVNNVVYLTHPSYPPMRLSYWGTNSSNPPFTIGEVPWKWAQMGDVNATTTSITPSGTTTTLSPVALSYVTTTATGTYTNHGLYIGQPITISGSAQANYNGSWVVASIPTADTFTFLVTTAPAATSTGSLSALFPALAGATTTLTASSGIFTAAHVGSYWQIAHPNPSSTLSLAIDTTNATSGAIKILGKWSLQTFGTWTATIDLQASSDNGINWKTVRTYKSAADYNATSSGEEFTDTLFRLKVSNYAVSTYVGGTAMPTTTSFAPRVMLSPVDPTLKGLVRITGFTSSTVVTAKVIKDLGNATATAVWNEGAFSSVKGYPSSCSIHESRIIFAGTSESPSTIWGSVTNDFENFRQGAYDADSYSFTLASNSGGRIQWLTSKTGLLVGTTQDEWSLSSSDGTRPLTPTNVLAKKQSRYGSTSLPALIINDTVIYLQKMGRKLREFVYTWNSETWISNDLTALGEHVTRGGIVEQSYQRVPDAILWLVRTDGQLISMTYEREQQVVGFSRHITLGGTFESVATINGLNGEDEVYVSVKRVINGATVRYIERFRTGMRDALDNADTSSWWYLDAAVKKTFGSPTSTITGLSHLEGQTVSVWADNAVGSLIVTQPTVVSGSITLQSPASSVLIGLPYTSTLTPMMLQKDLQDGTSAGRRMRVNKMNVKVYNSLAGEYSSDGVTWFPLVSRHLSDNMDNLPPVLLGYERVSVSSNWKDGVDISIRQTLPMPLTVVAIAASWDSAEAGQ
jgi:hypothetical protein